MNLDQINHSPNFLGCYPVNEEELKISITTGKDIEKVFIYAGDPFSAGISGDEHNWIGEKLEMKKSNELSTRYIWSIIIRPIYKRLKYHFEIVKEDEKVYLFEDDFYKDISNISKSKTIQRFIYPWINKADVCKVPGDISNIIWYQIFPERYCRGNMNEKIKVNQNWETKEDESWHEFYGGDIEGIRSKLKYISSLGFNGIYLNPILKSDSNHKYDTIDYKTIDPDFGTEEEFIKMVDEAHELNIKVMIDAVFNHCSDKCFLWQDVLEKGESSKYFSWFFINNFPKDKLKMSSKNGDYYTFSFVNNMPKLNTNNPEVMEYLLEIAKHWVVDWKIDGIRFDVGNEISHTFIKRLRKELKEIKPDLFLLGEIWHNSLPWLLGDEYDSVMNYPFLAAVNNFWADKNMKGENLKYSINKCYSMYYDQINNVLFNILDSHDTDRLIDQCNYSEDVFFQKLVLLLTMQGSPSLYYGTEIGLTGTGNKANRKCMPWNDIESGKYDEFMEQIKKLINIRKLYPQTKSNNIEWHVDNHSRVIHYVKKGLSLQDLSIYINADNIPIEHKNNKGILFKHRYKKDRLLPGGIIIQIEDKER